MKISHWNADWLRLTDWSIVEGINSHLCDQKSALHKPTSDGYEATKSIWETSHRQLMTIQDAAALCRKCHRLAPYCFYNGNTFTVAIRQAIIPIIELLDAEHAFLFRSGIGHYVAGTIAEDEFLAILEDLPEVDPS